HEPADQIIHHHRSLPPEPVNKRLLLPRLVPRDTASSRQPHRYRYSFRRWMPNSPGGMRRWRPWWFSSPLSRRPGTQRPPSYRPSSMLAMPAIGSPGPSGANVTTMPEPATTYSPGPTAMMRPPPTG